MEPETTIFLDSKHFDGLANCVYDYISIRNIYSISFWSHFLTLGIDEHRYKHGKEEVLNNSRKIGTYNWKLVNIMLPKWGNFSTIWLSLKPASGTILSKYFLRDECYLSLEQEGWVHCSCPFRREYARCNMAFWPLHDDLWALGFNYHVHDGDVICHCFRESSSKY